jgi:hypothetical protein
MSDYDDAVIGRVARERDLLRVELDTARARVAELERILKVRTRQTQDALEETAMLWKEVQAIDARDARWLAVVRKLWRQRDAANNLKRDNS